MVGCYRSIYLDFTEDSMNRPIDGGEDRVPAQALSRGRNPCPAPGSGEELQQGAVDLLVVRPGDGVRSAFDDHHLHVAEHAR